MKEINRPEPFYQVHMAQFDFLKTRYTPHFPEFRKSLLDDVTHRFEINAEIAVDQYILKLRMDLLEQKVAELTLPTPASSARRRLESTSIA